MSERSSSNNDVCTLNLRILLPYSQVDETKFLTKESFAKMLKTKFNWI